jgi:catalase-peroxidase
MRHLILSSALLFSTIGIAQEKKAECPMGHGKTTKTETPEKREAAMKGPSNKDWWPNKLNLEVLKQHSEKSNPMGQNFDYIKEFKFYIIITRINKKFDDTFICYLYKI